MAQWNETLEPYIKVKETVHTATLNPTAGEDLIIGATLISDSGPATPTLISSQSEFLETYASQDLSKDYLKSLDSLFEGDDKTTASTMFANAYRLAGSNTMLICRATKANDIYFAKPLQKNDLNTYILRDGALLKKVPEFKLVIDVDKDTASPSTDGWAISINGVGVIGNRVSDDGPQYDYFVNNLPDLVDQLNETSMFFSPDYTFYSDANSESGNELDKDQAESAKSVIFHEVYLGQKVLYAEDRCPEGGLAYVIVCQPDWTTDNPTQQVIDLNTTAYSDFETVPYYALNYYNSSTDLRVRIRRFNHDAVASKTLTTVSCNEASDSPWTVLTQVLDTYTKKGTAEPSDSILERDFYEICIQDPSIADEPQFFNIGNITGRGDMTPAELNSNIKMIQVQLPDDMRELGLNYYGYDPDDNVWTVVRAEEAGEPKGNYSTFDELKTNVTNPAVGDSYIVGTGGNNTYYQWAANGETQIYANLTIDPTESKILNVSLADMQRALDTLAEDEVYVTEGLCDLGCTDLSFQNYMANMAINENYFYPISTVNSTNYMTIGNNATKITGDSYKLYLNSPWDLDSGTLGWSFYASPAVLYWETVARNRRNNNEFAPIMGQSNGTMSYQSPVAEFNKKTRQLLLTRKVNTLLWDNQINAWCMNDNYTKQTADNIMSDEANSRLAIRISKAMPVLLKQFIGWRITPRLWAEATNVIDYWFKTNILSMNYNLDAYQIIIDESNNPVEIQRQNKMQILLNVRYQRALKFVTVKSRNAVLKLYKLLERDNLQSAA